MKKLMMILAVVILATACEGPPGPPGPMGPSGEDGGGVRKLVIDNIEVMPQDWLEKWENINGTNTLTGYMAEIRIDEFTQWIFDNGFYYTYWKYVDDQGSKVFFIQEGEGATIYKKDGDIYYEETITCDYMAGYLTVYFRSSDFKSEPPNISYFFRFVAFY